MSVAVAVDSGFIAKRDLESVIDATTVALKH
jgi:hypothetical protein